MKSDEKEQERGFTVVDRRGEASQDGGATTAGGHATELPRVDFSSFCISLGTSALYHLGVIGDPETGETVSVLNRPLAQQTIEALEMLRDKTRGNLDEEEQRILDSLLYELRMRFVEVRQSQGA